MSNLITPTELANTRRINPLLDVVHDMRDENKKLLEEQERMRTEIQRLQGLQSNLDVGEPRVSVLKNLLSETFPLFSTLPPAVRQRVWRCALRTPQIIATRMIVWRTNNGCIHVERLVPIISHSPIRAVSKESREQALKLQRDISGQTTGDAEFTPEGQIVCKLPGVYGIDGLDMLWITNYHNQEIVKEHPWTEGDSEWIPWWDERHDPYCTRLAIPYQIWHYCMKRREALLEIVGRFRRKGVIEFVLVIGPEDSRHMFRPGLDFRSPVVPVLKYFGPNYVSHFRKWGSILSEVDADFLKNMLWQSLAVMGRLCVEEYMTAMMREKNIIMENVKRMKKDEYESDSGSAYWDDDIDTTILRQYSKRLFRIPRISYMEPTAT